MSVLLRSSPLVVLLIFLSQGHGMAQAQRATKGPIPIASGNTVTAADIRYLGTCKFTPKLKEGMTNGEANDAIDAAWERFVDCWKNRGKKK